MSTRAKGYKAAGALAMYRAVVIDANGKADYPSVDGDHVFGVTTEAVTADEATAEKAVNVQREGECFGEAGGAFAAGDLLRAQKDDGKLVKAAATATMDSTNAKSDVYFTAKHKYQGGQGDEINVTFTDPSGNDKSLVITVSGRDIDVSLATGGAGAITSTAAEIKAAIEADAGANDLVSVEIEDDGSGVVEAIAKTYLSGGIGEMAVALMAASADGEQVRVDLGGVV